MKKEEITNRIIIKEPKIKAITTKITKSEYNKLDELSKKIRRKKSSIIYLIISDFLNKIEDN